MLGKTKIIFSVFLLIVLVFVLSACNSKVVSIEDYTWKMRTVMSKSTEVAQNENEFVVAVGEADELYPTAQIINLKLVAKNGVITITDETNNKTYTGSYKVQKKTPKGTDYEIIIDDIKGYATVAPTEYYDGSEVPTLPINLGDYGLYFIPANN